MQLSGLRDHVPGHSLPLASHCRATSTRASCDRGGVERGAPCALVPGAQARRTRAVLRCATSFSGGMPPRCGSSSARQSSPGRAPRAAARPRRLRQSSCHRNSLTAHGSSATSAVRNPSEAPLASRATSRRRQRSMTGTCRCRRVDFNAPLGKQPGVRQSGVLTTSVVMSNNDFDGPTATYTAAR